jgi:carboxypeptidase C (cathepsin A)
MAEAVPPSPPAGAAADEAAKRQKEHVEKLLARAAAESQGTVQIGSRRLEYTAQAAFLPILGDGFAAASAEPQAAVLTTAYLLKGAAAADRPVCFAFNGGPGSASVWLHLGALGPKRVAVPDDGTMPMPPYAVEDNPHSWFEHFDLVFIDPPHTGWSACASDAARKKMLAVDGDVEVFAEVIRLWLTRHHRWGSAVLLAGESYGTTRGAAIADKLQGMGVALSGLVLVSCAMDIQSIVFAPANDLPYALFLPAFANVAQYHGLLAGAVGATPAAARTAAESFVHEEYVAALHTGARLTNPARSRIAKRLSELTGLPRALVEEKNLRIADQTFFFEALRERGLMTGRLDARATGPMAASRTRDWEFDPGIEAIAAPYTMAAMAYFREVLGIDLETRYQVLSTEVHRSWGWSRADGAGGTREGFVSTSPDLARALRRNPHLKVLAASGRYDLGTPYSASDWSLAQLDVPADVMARVTHRYYDAGHMMYTRQADLMQLKADVAAWYRSGRIAGARASKRAAAGKS